ncbi:MAG: DUF948 domain-containing protein [Gemmatimonadaceae bacterium]
MICTTASVGLWPLLQQAAAVLPDTIVTKTADPGWFGKVTALADGLMTIALLVLAVFLVPAAWNFRNSHKKWNQLLERVYGDINPIMGHASSIADNVDYITTSIRTDVQQVNATIAAANQRLHQAVAVTEERLNQFSALLEVVQNEAEQLFVSTASAARGVRAGAASLARGTADPASVVVEFTDEQLDEEGAQEEDHGDDIRSTSETQSARPRVRPRARRRDWA